MKIFVDNKRGYYITCREVFSVKFYHWYCILLSGLIYQPLRTHWKYSTILKTSKKEYEVMFFDTQKYVYSESVFNTLYIEMKHKYYKKFLRTKKNGIRNALFFSQAPTHHSFTFNLRFLYALKHKVCLSKTVCWIFHFRFCFVFIKVYIFVQQNAKALWL